MTSNLGRYRLVERVAQGGMGEVYRGLDVGYEGIERPVAVKVIAPSFAREPEFVRTFVDEARLSFLLSHSNVVHVRDFGQVDETWFIAMEWVEGGDLGAILRKMRDRVGQPMPMRFAVLVAVEAARGLDYAHRLRDASGRRLQVVHRDISPSNVLVSFEGEVKITDFGIARSRMRTTPSLPGALKGKIGYLAPEQARGEDVDARADIYALGVVLYEMLTAQNPFTHEVSEREALNRVQKGAFQPPRLALPALPQGLEAIVLRAMAPERDHRYADCGAMREDLETFARREGYSLSPSDLGVFVKELLTAPEPAVDETRPARIVTKPRTTAPKPFDVALGESLAMLQYSDDLPAVADVTAPGKRQAEAPRTVAVHPVIEKPPSAQRPVAKESEETEQIPRSYSPRTAWIAVAIGAAAVVSLAVTLLHRSSRASGSAQPRRSEFASLRSAHRSSSAGEVLPPVVAPSRPTPVAVVPVPSPRQEKLTFLPEPHSDFIVSARRQPRQARLSIDSDVPANIYIDGAFVKETPLADLELTPGAHTIRAESSESGLRLIPREEKVTLKAGESRHLTMDLQ